MKIAVDTNILFSFFWKSSLTRKLLITSNLALLSPEKALIEINKYKKEIMEKIGIKEKEFRELFSELRSVVTFVRTKEYAFYLDMDNCITCSSLRCSYPDRELRTKCATSYAVLCKAKQISPDSADTDFFALCLQNSCPLWSNDKLLKYQDKIKVFSTDEIIEMFV